MDNTKTGAHERQRQNKRLRDDTSPRRMQHEPVHEERERADLFNTIQDRGLKDMIHSYTGESEKACCYSLKVAGLDEQRALGLPPEFAWKETITATKNFFVKSDDEGHPPQAECAESPSVSFINFVNCFATLARDLASTVRETTQPPTPESSIETVEVSIRFPPSFYRYNMYLQRIDWRYWVSSHDDRIEETFKIGFRSPTGTDYHYQRVGSSFEWREMPDSYQRMKMEVYWTKVLVPLLTRNCSVQGPIEPGNMKATVSFDKRPGSQWPFIGSDVWADFDRVMLCQRACRPSSSWPPLTPYMTTSRKFLQVAKLARAEPPLPLAAESAVAKQKAARSQDEEEREFRAKYRQLERERADSSQQKKKKAAEEKKRMRDFKRERAEWRKVHNRLREEGNSFHESSESSESSDS